MVRRLALAALIALPSSYGLAQQPSAGGTARCGGLLCDLYYAGKPAPAPGQPEAPDPTHLPCHDFLCAAFGGRTPEPAPPAAEPAVAPSPAMPAKTARHKTKARKTVAAADVSANK